VGRKIKLLKLEVNMEQNFEYFAFISYKREDEKWAKWLHRKLENYKLPTVIAHERPELPKKLNPVFRDTTDIKPGVLADVLNQNLNSSKYLIVICSPLAAKSKWVGKEISDFIALGKQNNIILFIVDGIPYSNNPVIECYHPVIKERLPEMLGVNINEEGNDWKYIKKQKAFIRIVTSLLNVSFDSLWQRQKRRIIRNFLTGILSGLLFIMTLIGVSVYQYKINQPFNVHISLKENTFHNTNLPFENGRIRLCYDKDTLVSKPINSYSEQISFNNIPGKFKGKIANVRFEMFGFVSHDTIVNLNPNIFIMIARDNTYSVSFGVVRDALSYKPLKGVKVNVNQLNSYTNDSGHFNIKFLAEQQSERIRLTAIKDGYQSFECEGKPSSNAGWEILLQKNSN
jgi:hypothetical protein